MQVGIRPSRPWTRTARAAERAASQASSAPDTDRDAVVAVRWTGLITVTASELD